MIGVVNPNSTETLDLQEQYAINATTQLAPGEPFPSETLSPTHTPLAGSTDSAAPGTDDHEHHGLSAGAIAGIAIGGAAVLILAGALVFLCGRRGGLDKAYRRSTQTFPPPVVDTKYNPTNPSNPKSPGQETYSTAHYSVPAANDPYRTNSPHTFASSPPPTTPNSHPAYSTYSSAGGHPNVQSPLMAGLTDGTQGY